MYKIIAMKYRMHKITAGDVWAYVDEGKITVSEAVAICGPRPKE